MFGWCLFFLALGCISMMATKPASIEDINFLASVENLRAVRVAHVMKRPNEKNVSFGAFSIWGIFFSCRYERWYIDDPAYPSSRDVIFEMIKATVLGHRGTLIATFENDKVTSWTIKMRMRISTSTEIDDHHRWILEHLLATIQNAISTNLMPSTVAPKHKAIPR